MFSTPSFKKSLIVEQFQGNYLKEQAIVVARGKPAKIVSKKQQVQFIQSNFYTNKPKVI